MNFGEALDLLKRGERVARAGWNGKGMWLALVEATQWSADGSPSVAPVPGSHLKRLPWIGMKTADNGFVPWLASQTDILAEDWEGSPSDPR